jgi:hypothetical protein
MKKNGNWKDRLSVCKKCGKQVKSYYAKFCKKCWGKSIKGKNHPNWKGGWKNNFPKCNKCGKQVKDCYAKLCQKCLLENRKGKNNPNYRHGKTKCKECGTQLTGYKIKKCKKCWSKGVKGKNNWNWKGGITPIKKRLRQSFEYKQWRQKNSIRFDFTCQEPKCNQRGGKLHVHHKKSFSVLMHEAHDYMPLLDWYDACLKYTPLWDINNGIVYCKDCHRKEHKRLKNLKKNKK